MSASDDDVLEPPTYVGVDHDNQENAIPLSFSPDDPNYLAILGFKAHLILEDQNEMQAGASGINRLLCRDNPPITQVIAAGVVPRLIELAYHPNEEILYPSLWALSNVASGGTKDVLYLIEHGALTLFKHQLEGGSLKIREQAAWAIGNVAGDSPKLRDVCLEAGVLPLILELALCHQKSPAGVANWALSNLCRGSPGPPREEVLSAVMVVAAVVMTTRDDDTLLDGIWTVGYLAKGADIHQVQVASTGVIPRLLEILRTPGYQRPEVLVPTLQAVGHLTAGPDIVTAVLVKAGLVDVLAPLLVHRHSGTQKEAFWTLSNICAGTHAQVAEGARLIPLAIDRLINLPNSRPDILTHVAFCVTNAATGAPTPVARELIEKDIFSALLSILQNPALVKQDDVQYVTLDAIHTLLRKSGLIQMEKITFLLPTLVTLLSDIPADSRGFKVSLQIRRLIVAAESSESKDEDELEGDF